MPIRHGVRASKNVKTQPRRSRFLTMKRLADMLPFLQINRFTRVYRAHVLAALTRPLARRLCRLRPPPPSPAPVSYTHLRAHETRHDLVCRLLLEKKKINKKT